VTPFEVKALALTLALGIPICLAVSGWRGLGRRAEAGHVANITMLMAFVAWCLWVTIAILWLMWRIRL
jgi:hypothetical protein